MIYIGQISLNWDGGSESLKKQGYFSHGLYGKLRNVSLWKCIDRHSQAVSLFFSPIASILRLGSAVLVRRYDILPLRMSREHVLRISVRGGGSSCYV